MEKTWIALVKSNMLSTCVSNMDTRVTYVTMTHVYVILNGGHITEILVSESQISRVLCI